MVQINPTYPIPPEPIASFDFVDLAEGTGKVIYLGISSKDASAVNYHLVSNPTFSSQKVTTRGTAGTTSMDFDVAPFNLPRTAKGTAFFSAGLHTNTHDVHLDVQVKKFDGSTETNVSSKITSETLGSGPAATMIFLEIPLTQTHFERGDILRLTVDLVHGGPSQGAVGHDPKDREVSFSSVAMDSSVMEFQMSFRIEQ